MSETPRGDNRLGRLAFDLALTVVMAWTAIELVLELDAGTSLRGPTWSLIALALVHTLPIAVRRQWPTAALVTSIAAAAVALALGVPSFRFGPTILVLLYTTAALRPRSTSLAGLVATLPLVVLSVRLSGYGFDRSTIVLYSALGAGAWLLGDTVRQREEAAEAHAERARLLDQARGELARAAVAAERLRIARELHDVVAHGLSVIAVHAGSGRLAAPRDPAAAATALATIERSSRDTLDQMRRLLGVLREDGDAPATAPLPDLHALPALVASYVAAGVDVELELDADVDALPPGLHLAAYRLVQEALTNVLRHAGPVRTRILVRATAEVLEVDVVDDGALPAVGASERSSPGHGTSGMRERVAMYGGDLTIGPVPGGGWRVRARLPRTEAPVGPSGATSRGPGGRAG